MVNFSLKNNRAGISDIPRTIKLKLAVITVEHVALSV